MKFYEVFNIFVLDSPVSLTVTVKTNHYSLVDDGLDTSCGKVALLVLRGVPRLQMLTLDDSVSE